MAATPITQATRYFAAGISKCYFVSTIADYSAPTRAELDAGTDLSPEIAAIEGWMVTGSAIDTPDLATRYTGNIPGRTSSEESNITFYASQDGVDVRAELPRDTSGFIVWMDGGDVDGNFMDVFPIRVMSNTQQRSIEDEAARRQVAFSIPREPAEGVAIPAAV